jgi:hypothetical protein
MVVVELDVVIVMDVVEEDLAAVVAAGQMVLISLAAVQEQEELEELEL